MSGYITGSEERTIGGLSLEQFEAPMSEVLGATFDQALYDNPASQLLRVRERSRAEYEGNRLPAETVQARFEEAGVKYKVPNSGMTESLANLILEDKKNALKREQVMARAPGGVVNGSLQFATALGASLLDPLNIASAFIPVVGEARAARMLETAGASTLARAGARARIGAMEGAAGQAMLEPLMAFSASEDQIDYGMADTLRNIAFGAVMGTTLHAGGGFVKDRFTAPAAKPGAAADIVQRLNPETHQSAMKAAVAQAASGRMVDVEAVVKLDGGAVEAVAKDGELATWFAGSKVVEEEGKPLVVYHGTDESFDAFDMDKAVDGAHFFTPNESHAASFGDPKPYYVKMENPMEITQRDLDEAWDREHPDGEQDGRNLLPRDFVREFIERAKAEGHDGLVIREMADREIQADMYLPFNSAQIRSAAGEARVFRDSQPKDHDLSEVRSAAERSQAPESSIAADLKAAADAEQQLKDAPKDYDLEAAQAQLTESMQDLKATADQLGVEPGLKQFDDQLARAAQYEKALKAAAVCGLRG
jgi:hypothetical protein